MNLLHKLLIGILVVYVIGFGFMYAVAASMNKKIEATGYEDTIVMVSMVENDCNAVVFKIGESKRYISCEEAKQIIATFPKKEERK